MQALQTAVIEHTTAQGVHHDWLIEDPSLPDPAARQARLWTARVLPVPAQWERLGRFDLQVIAPHRRAYLTYQGQVSGGRGRVRRIAQGTCFASRWSDGWIVLECHWPEIQAWQLRRLSSDRWLAERVFRQA